MAIFSLSYAAGLWAGFHLSGANRSGQFQLGCTIAALALLIWAWRGARGIPLILAAGLVGGVAGSRTAGPPMFASASLANVAADARVVDSRGTPDGSVQLTVEICRSYPAVAAEQRRAILRLPANPEQPNLMGRQVHFAADLRPLHDKVNPGLPRIWRPEIAWIADIVSPLGLVVWSDYAAPCAESWLRQTGMRWLRTAATCQARLAQQIERWVAPPESQLLAALTFGARAALPIALEDSFRRLGISHVLSVSGLHFAVLLWFLFGPLARSLFFLPWVGRGRPIDWYLAIPAVGLVWGYALVVGAEIATLRSALFVTLWLGARLLYRANSARRALWMTGWSILVCDPHALLEPSFQLSFVATWALLYLAVVQLPGQAALLPPERTRLQKVIYATVKLFVCSLAATVATVPITAWHFAQLSWIGVVANLLLVPPFEWITLPATLAGAGLSLIGGNLGRWPLLVAGFVAHQLCRAIAFWGRYAGDSFVAQPSLWVVFLWFVALALFVVRGKRRWALALWTLSCLLWWGQTYAAQHSGAVRFTFLDIGQGDSTIVELPYGRVWLIDGGGSFDPLYDPGEKILAKVLRKKGIRKIDRLIITHPHPDHANGLAYIVQNFPVNEIWYSGERTGLPSVLAIFAHAQERQIPVRFPGWFDQDGVTVEPLGPRRDDGTFGAKPMWRENDNSLVLLFTFHGRRVLFTGDIEVAAESELTALHIGPIDALKVPHHGSKTSSTAPFLAPLRPRWAIASLGYQNRWHFPHAQVVRRYRELGSTFLRTDESGAITIDISPSGRMCRHTEREPTEICE